MKKKANFIKSGQIPQVIYTGNKASLVGALLGAFIDDTGTYLADTRGNAYCRLQECNVAWDLTDLTTPVNSVTLGSVCYGFRYKQDGSKRFEIQWQSGTIRLRDVSLSENWNPTTESLVASTILLTGVSAVYSFDITRDGTALVLSYADEDSADYKVAKFTLSTAWLGSTATLTQEVSCGIELKNITLTADGKGIISFTQTGGTYRLYKYKMSTALDLSLLVEQNSISISSIFNPGNITYADVHLDATGTHLLLSGYNSNPDVLLLQLTVPNQLGELLDNS